MIPRILNLQARPPECTEPCAPDVRYFPLDTSVIAFDTNTLVAVEISKEQHAALTAPRESEVRLGQAPVADENPPHALLFSKRRPKFDLGADVSCRQLTLHFSDQCNQRCAYCWIRTAGETPPLMTPEIAEAALNMFPHDGRDLRISFFGGEPLLQFDLVHWITERIEKRAAREKRRAFFHVTTNATLITPAVAEFLARHGFSIIVSCDGPERIHDAARGAGSHAAMMRGLCALRNASHGLADRILLRGTWSGIPAEVLARLGALNQMCAKGLARGVALEPVAGASYGHTLDAEIRSACNWFGLHAKSGGRPRWQYLEKTLQRILWQQFRPSECGAGRGYYTVGPTGTIYACHKQQNAEIGRIRGAAEIDESKRGKWLDNRFCARRECSLCWARHVCGGSCRSESLEFCGGIEQPHAGRCMLMRQLVAESLRLSATLPRETLLRICPAPDFRNSRRVSPAAVPPASSPSRRFPRRPLRSALIRKNLKK